MSKRKSLQQILTTVSMELRWPRQGDTPFVAAEDPLSNANVINDEFSRLVRMVDGYKKAAELMVGAAAESKAMRDTLVFPIIFNYRQFVELSLKYQLWMFGSDVDVEHNWRSHDLVELWTSFSEMLNRYGTDDPDDADKTVEGIILEFAKIDPKSYSYRYPMDRRGRPIPITHSNLHLPTLADVMNRVSGYFDACDGYLSDRQGARRA